MKTILLLTFSTITLATQAQSSIYHPFPDSGAVWVVNYTFIDTCIEEDEYVYVFDGDTLINSYTYHKITVPVVKNIPPNQCSEVSPPPIGYRGAIRQDTIAKKVYFVAANLTSERVLYNFSLNIGDTIHNSFWSLICGSSPIYQVTTIDSILIGQTYRKRIVFNNSIPLSIIEGIGSVTGLLEPLCNFFEVRWQLDCFSQNDTALYTGSASQHYCDLANSVNNIPKNVISITLFPNPATTLLTITATSTQPSQIILYDITARQLMQQRFSGSATLNIANLAKGVYIYEVRDEKGVVKRGKVVKE